MNNSVKEWQKYLLSQPTVDKYDSTVAVVEKSDIRPLLNSFNF